jgi:hypothetical protein
MDDVAEQILVNYDTAQAWYQAPGVQDEPSVVYDYVIITTNAIEAGSSKLADFITHKESQGYSVLIITEDEYGSLSGQPPNGTAEKIRKWLQDNYSAYSIKYVLLMGNPDPDDPSDGGDSVGDVPMKMCWPRRTQVSDKESPTDYFFADLTGNWDLDGDQYFGEWGDDTGTGGVDLANEVYVGRIPVYGAAYTTLDGILQKIMDYENEANPESWRKSALLPISFSTTTYDGAPLAEQMKDDYLTAAGFSSWTQYQQGNGACGLDSIYASNEELRGGTVVRDRWAANDYGLVLWWAHGSQTSASVGCDGCWDGTLFSSSQTSSLDDDHPSFVYQNSCHNGYPESTNNLQYALLKHGAIGAVGATRLSWFIPGQGYGDFDGSTTNAGIGYEYARRLVQGQAAGAALYNAKSSLSPSGTWWLMNLYDFNLYGDPSTKILSTPAAPSNLQATTVSQTQINLSWTDNSTNESGFKIERSPNGTSSWTQIATVGANVTAYSNTGLTCNTTYYYRVRAYNAGGDSSYSNVANATTSDGSSWSSMTSGTSAWLHGVWGSSGSDVFAVGESGTILHYDGSSWSSMTSGTSDSLDGVWGGSGSDVFAMGSGGTILHYDGSSWSSMTSGTSLSLGGVWGSSGSDVFAVGGNGTILHYDGSSWSSMTSGTSRYLRGVWGGSGSDVFAVGESGTILHYDGSSWSSMTSGTSNCDQWHQQLAP